LRSSSRPLGRRWSHSCLRLFSQGADPPGKPHRFPRIAAGPKARTRNALRILAPAAALLLVAPSFAAGAGDGDWPCDAPFEPELTIADVWDGSAPEAPSGSWKERAEVRRVVNEAATPANPPEHGQKAIRELAAGIEGERRQTLLLVLQGVLERTNQLRDAIVGGVRSFSIRADILRESASEKGDKADRLEAEGASSEEIAQYREARESDLRQLDEAEEEAQFHCGRYEYARDKLDKLAGTIQDLIQTRDSG